MQAQSPDLHTIIEGVSALVTFAGFVILLMVRNNQSSVKEDLIKKQIEIKDDLVEAQNQMRGDMDKKHAENSQSIAVHVAEDKVQFANIKSEITDVKLTLAKMDGKLDSLTSKQRV